MNHIKILPINQDGWIGIITREQRVGKMLLRRKWQRQQDKDQGGKMLSHFYKHLI